MFSSLWGFWSEYKNVKSSNSLEQSSWTWARDGTPISGFKTRKWAMRAIAVDPKFLHHWQSHWQACPRKSESSSKVNNVNNTILKLAVPGWISFRSPKSGAIVRIMIRSDCMSSSSEIVQGTAKLPAHTRRAGIISLVHVLPTVSAEGIGFGNEDTCWPWPWPSSKALDPLWCSSVPILGPHSCRPLLHLVCLLHYWSVIPKGSMHSSNRYFKKVPSWHTIP